MSKIKETEIYLGKIINELGYEVEKVKLESSSMKNLGQFQLNIAMPLAKKYKKNPREIADEIVSKLDDRFVNVNIAGPGFINLSFSEKELLEYSNKAINNFDIHIDREEPKMIIVDYGGANAAKALHVGHMRAANIGEALKRLAKLYNKNVLGDVHLGDLGRQAGMLISELKLERPDLPYFDPNYKGEYPKIDLTTEDLGRMYPKANIAAKEDPKRMEEVRFITAEIDKGNEVYTKLWKQMVDISSVEIKKIYEELNCNFELWEGELDAFKEIPEVLEIMKPFLYESDGALIMDVANENDSKPMPPLMVIKSDGATIYATRDLGTIHSRMKRFKPDEIWYVVDQRQALYFEQVFRGSYISGLVPKTTLLAHFGFGTMNGKDGKPFKTRDGGVLKLSDLMDLVREEIDKRIKPEITGDEREKIKEKLTIAAIKFADLSPIRKTDYIFDPVKFSSFEGKTGPYILYTMVRIKSILNKIDKNKDYKIEKIVNEDMENILVKIVELSRTLKSSYDEKTLNYITDYLYDLCSLFNKFYSKYNIINEKDEKVKDSYIAMINLIYNTCFKLLDTLAIETVEKM
ncbi:MAG: arginine--tRNA ligase [Bacilli bacterium]